MTVVPIFVGRTRGIVRSLLSMNCARNRRVIESVSGIKLLNGGWDQSIVDRVCERIHCIKEFPMVSYNQY